MEKENPAGDIGSCGVPFPPRIMAYLCCHHLLPTARFYAEFLITGRAFARSVNSTAATCSILKIACAPEAR
jgi:hypothetical protein